MYGRSSLQACSLCLPAALLYYSVQPTCAQPTARQARGAGAGQPCTRPALLGGRPPRRRLGPCMHRSQACRHAMWRHNDLSWQIMQGAAQAGDVGAQASSCSAAGWQHCKPPRAQAEAKLTATASPCILPVHGSLNHIPAPAGASRCQPHRQPCSRVHVDDLRACTFGGRAAHQQGKAVCLACVQGEPSHYASRQRPPSQAMAPVLRKHTSRTGCCWVPPTEADA